MADYIYLLEHRLSAAQQRTLSLVRDAVRARDLTLFLTGGAVRDLTGGGSVRDLDVTVQGPVAPLQADLEAAGGVLIGEFAPAQALFFTFPGGVQLELSSAMSVTYPKPGKPQYAPTNISEDLRRRDFTANAMALSLNEGSYGLLMDPLNGIADIENRELRLISNYGFIEDPVRMVRAIRLSSRLGFQMEERTRQRYDNSKAEDALAVLSPFARGYETEEIFHEEDPQRIMRALDAEGWLTQLAPQLALGKANESALSDLRDKQGQLQTQGIVADSAIVSFPILLAKLPPADIAALKASFARPGFARAIDALEERTRELQTRFSGKEAALPSAAWRLLYEAEPNLVLSMFFSAKGGTAQSRLKTFLTESPTARQRLPYAILQEMRIAPDLPIYNELLDKIFFELMDGKLQTPEEIKAYIEPYSPPAPPPPINLRRARAKKEARPSRAKAKKAVPATVAEQEESIGVAEGLLEPGTLTGPDRGTEPTLNEPLEGKVAPLPTGAAEPVPSSPRRPRPSPKPVVVPPPTHVAAASVSSDEASAAQKLRAKPAPMPASDANLIAPHPLAAKEIAQAKTATLPITPPAAASVKTPPPPAPPALKAAPPRAGTPAAQKPAPATATPANASKTAPVKSSVVVKPANNISVAQPTNTPVPKLAGKVAPPPAVPQKLAAANIKAVAKPQAPPAQKIGSTKPSSTVAKSQTAPARKSSLTSSTVKSTPGTSSTVKSTPGTKQGKSAAIAKSAPPKQGTAPTKPPAKPAIKNATKSPAKPAPASKAAPSRKAVASATPPKSTPATKTVAAVKQAAKPPAKASSLHATATAKRAATPAASKIPVKAAKSPAGKRPEAKVTAGKPKKR